MLVYKDGVVKHYKEMFPNVSFAASGPTDSFLADNNTVKVNLFKPYDKDTQKLVSCEPYVEDDWAYTVTVADKTQEDIDAEINAKAAQIRKQRDDALMASDWTQVLDAPVNRTAWATYRQALRDLPNNPDFPDVELPNIPVDTE
jgi:hypothetical protein